MTPPTQSGSRDKRKQPAPDALRRRLADALLDAGRAALLHPEPLHWTREYGEAQLAVLDRIRKLEPDQTWRVVRLCCFGDFIAAEALAVVTQADHQPDS